jgi:hypothetical protein
MMVVELLESCVEIHGATKIRILFFYPSIVRYSREEENRQLERFHLTLNPSMIAGAPNRERGGRAARVQATKKAKAMKSLLDDVFGGLVWTLIVAAAMVIQGSVGEWYRKGSPVKPRVTTVSKSARANPIVTSMVIVHARR